MPHVALLPDSSSCVSGRYSLSSDWDLYRLLSKDHTPLPDQEGVWLCELRDAYWEEVKRRHKLPNDRESVGEEQRGRE